MERTSPTIQAYREGPLLVRGPVVIIDEDGRPLDSRRPVVPLCRCGRSRSKPLCDGAHEAAAVRSRPDAEAAPREKQPSVGASPDTEHRR